MKPYRVLYGKQDKYWGAFIGSPKTKDFSTYWQANAFSWFLHHVHGYGCNLLKKADVADGITILQKG